MNQFVGFGFDLYVCKSKHVCTIIFEEGKRERDLYFDLVLGAEYLRSEKNRGKGERERERERERESIDEVMKREKGI